jgi:hypothetical protein
MNNFNKLIESSRGIQRLRRKSRGEMVKRHTIKDPETGQRTMRPNVIFTNSRGWAKDDPRVKRKKAEGEARIAKRPKELQTGLRALAQKAEDADEKKGKFRDRELYNEPLHPLEVKAKAESEAARKQESEDIKQLQKRRDAGEVPADRPNRNYKSRTNEGTPESFEQYLTTFLVETMGVMPTPEDRKKEEEAKKRREELLKPQLRPELRNPKQEAMDRAKKRREEGGSGRIPTGTRQRFGEGSRGERVPDKIMGPGSPVERAQREKEERKKRKPKWKKVPDKIMGPGSPVERAQREEQERKKRGHEPPPRKSW